MISSQMLKGTLEGSILTIIGMGETYGYEISMQLEKYGFGTISEGTIYPLLLRLERNALITAVYRQSATGPKRKYYSLTQQGVAELQAFAEGFKELEYAIEKLFHAYKRGNEHE